ncbi:MAG: hypothetical protein LC745_06830 [Planctomycetia bacterium]|nr:hypothetical protein [Planctomycetia bacterium]
MPTPHRFGRVLLLAVLGLPSLPLTGCGSDKPPPPPNADEFKEVKKEREEIIKKEYGSGR